MKVFRWKRIIALLCCTVLLLTSLLNNVYAADKIDASNNLLLESEQTKIDEGLEQNLSYVEIAEAFTEAEWSALKERAALETFQEKDLLNSNIAGAITFDEEQLEEAEAIDKLAKEYFDYNYGENAEGDPSELD